MADIQIPQTIAANVPTPAASTWSLFADSASAVPAFKNSAGAFTSIHPFGTSATTTASGAINTTATTVTPTFNIPAGTMQVGTTYRVRVWGTCTSTVANLSTFTLRFGTAGNTTDPSVCTVTPTAAATGTAVPFVIEFSMTCRSTGGTGTVMGGGVLTNNGVTGVSATNAVVGGVAATLTISTLVANLITVSYSSAAVTTTCTFQMATIEIVKA